MASSPSSTAPANFQTCKNEGCGVSITFRRKQEGGWAVFEKDSLGQLVQHKCKFYKPKPRTETTTQETTIAAAPQPQQPQPQPQQQQQLKVLSDNIEYLQSEVSSLKTIVLKVLQQQNRIIEYVVDGGGDDDKK